MARGFLVRSTPRKPLTQFGTGLMQENVRCSFAADDPLFEVDPTVYSRFDPCWNCESEKATACGPRSPRKETTYSIPL